jgi:hypothetical protein
VLLSVNFIRSKRRLVAARAQELVERALEDLVAAVVMQRQLYQSLQAKR